MTNDSEDDEKEKEGEQGGKEDDGLLEWLGGLMGFHPVPPDVPPPMPSKVRNYFSTQVFNNHALRLMSLDGLSDRTEIRHARDFIEIMVDPKRTEGQKITMVYTHPRIAYKCVASLKQGLKPSDIAVPEVKPKFRG
jgi:hypothetical protein